MHRAPDTRLEREVPSKVLRPSGVERGGSLLAERDLVRRWIREARAPTLTEEAR